MSTPTVTPAPVAPKPWYTSKTNIAAMLTLAINIINALLQTPLIPPNIMAVLDAIVLPTVIFVLRTWFTDTPTTAPLGIGK